jgi:hypothetical protein
MESDAKSVKLANPQERKIISSWSCDGYFGKLNGTPVRFEYFDTFMIKSKGRQNDSCERQWVIERTRGAELLYPLKSFK